jgi:hypothetical protein
MDLAAGAATEEWPQALAMKGCPLPGPGTMRRTRIRVSHALATWQARGLVVSIGRGTGTRRVLVCRSEDELAATHTTTALRAPDYQHRYTNGCR